MRTMRPSLIAAFTATLASAALALTLPALAQDEAPALSPSDIINAAPQVDWVVIAPEDLLVMTLAPPAHGPGQADAQGNPRQVVIQLMPAPFSQGWVHNIRLLARSGWYDGTSVNRVQDNYVTQWGDPNYDNPEATGEAKPLPEGLKVMGEAEYVAPIDADAQAALAQQLKRGEAALLAAFNQPTGEQKVAALKRAIPRDPYSDETIAFQGWPFSVDSETQTLAPTHCYGMVGVGRNLSPDTGSGAELYTVIGHAPRHLDRNIALVGRVIEGMQHLSSLPRGSGALGFYSKEEADKRTPILSVRVTSDLPQEEQPLYEYLATETDTFAAYAEARANRRDEFFITPAGGADICNIPVPVRRFEYAEGD